MVDFLTINGWAPSVKDGSFSKSFEFGGDRAQVFSGKYSENRRYEKAIYDLSLTIQTAETARALKGLVLGHGNRWTFNSDTADLFSSKGHGPQPGHDGTPTTGKGYAGGQYGLQIASGGDFQLKAVIRDIVWNGQWTFMAHFGSTGDGHTYAQERILFRDNDTVGDGYLDGVAGTYAFDDIVTFSAVDTDGFTLLGQDRVAGASSVSFWDNIVILPYRVTDEQALAFSAADNEFSDLPLLTVRLANEETLTSAERLMTGDITDVKYVQAVNPTWAMDNQSMDIVFDESEPLDIPEPSLPAPNPLTLELDFDANQPGTGNVPTNIGLNAIGDLTLSGSGYTYEATGGPNGHAAHRYTALGYHYSISGSGALIQEHNITLAALVQSTDTLSNRVAFHACQGFDTKPGLAEFNVAAGTFKYKFIAGANSVPAAAITENTQWDVVIWNHQQNGANQDTRAWHAVHGSPTLEAMAVETTSPDYELGTKVNFGGSWAANDWHGRIARIMVWTEVVDENDILAYMNDHYGA